MRPYYDYSDSRTTVSGRSAFTPAVMVLLMINVGVFIVQRFMPDVARPFLLSLDGLRHWRVWQLLTYGFLHGGVLHITFNMIGLYIFGRELEGRYGTRRFLRLYLSAVVFGGAVFAGYAYLFSPGSYVLGASGGVVALMVVYAILWPKRQFLLFLVLPMPAWLLVLLFVLVDMGDALNQDLGAAVHVAGAVYGFGWLVLWPRLRGTRVRSRRANDRDRERMDRILDKVHAQGLHKLSWREKRFLTRMGRRMDEERSMDGHRLTRRPEWTDDSP